MSTPSLSAVPSTTTMLSDVHARLEAAFGPPRKHFGSGRLTLRFDALPAPAEDQPVGLSRALERLGAKIDFAMSAPLSLREGGGVKLQCAGEIDGVRFLGSAGGSDGQVDVELILFVDASEGNQGRDQAMFQMAEKLFSGPDGVTQLGRFVGHTLRALPQKKSRLLARSLAESLADYLSE